MPSYFFKCNDCDFITELKMKINDFISTDKSKVSCSSCDNNELSRVFSKFSSKVELRKDEIISNAKKEARVIADKVRSGDIRTIRNIYGEK